MNSRWTTASLTGSMAAAQAAPQGGQVSENSPWCVPACTPCKLVWTRLFVCVSGAASSGSTVVATDSGQGSGHSGGNTGGDWCGDRRCNGVPACSAQSGRRRCCDGPGSTEGCKQRPANGLRYSACACGLPLQVANSNLPRKQRPSAAVMLRRPRTSAPDLQDSSNRGYKVEQGCSQRPAMGLKQNNACCLQLAASRVHSCPTEVTRAKYLAKHLKASPSAAPAWRRAASTGVQVAQRTAHAACGLLLRVAIHK